MEAKTAESFEVCWSLPDPQIGIAYILAQAVLVDEEEPVNVSQNCTVEKSANCCVISGLKPYAQYNVSVKSCDLGNSCSIVVTLTSRTRPNGKIGCTIFNHIKKAKLVRIQLASTRGDLDRMQDL